MTEQLNWTDPTCLGFPGDSAVRNLPNNAGEEGWIPGLVRSPGEGNVNPLQYLSGKSRGQRSLAGYSPWGCKRVRYDLVTKQQQCYYYYCMKWCLERCSINLLTMVISTCVISSNFYSFIPFLYNLKFSSKHAIFLKTIKLFLKKIHMKYFRICSLEGCNSACNNFSNDQTA